MMSCDQISQNTSMCTKRIGCVYRTRGGVIHPLRPFDMRLGIVAADLFDVVLEFCAIFTQVVPQPGKPRPIGCTKAFGSIFRPIGYPVQMFAQSMFMPLNTLSDMRKRLLRLPVALLHLYPLQGFRVTRLDLD